MIIYTYSDFHALAGDQLHTAHDVLLHLDQLRQLTGEIRPESTSGIFTEGMAYRECQFCRIAVFVEKL